MSLIPMMRCRDMRASVVFYTTILDFERTDGDDDPAEYDFITLGRGGDQLALACDDGVFGTVVVVATPDVDAACFAGAGCGRRGIRTRRCRSMRGRSIRRGACVNSTLRILTETRFGSHNRCRRSRRAKNHLTRAA